MRTGERGFTYLGLLWAVALAGALAAAAATAWTARAERAAERELLFRGAQIALALERWQAQVPGAPGPQRLEDLLLDTRTSPPRRHLRRLWPDPATGEADWLLERDAAGAIVGLRSRSERPLRMTSALATGDTAATPTAPGATPRWRDLVFGSAPRPAGAQNPQIPGREPSAVVPTDQAWPVPPRGSVKPAS